MIFVCHGSPSLIHRPTYRRTNHTNLQATRTAYFARAIRGGHRRDIERHGDDTPEIRDVRRGARRAADIATK